MNHPYLPILVVLIMAMGFAGTFLGLSAIIGPKKFTKNKRSPYECGLDPVGGARDRVSVKFFLVAILFILFDVEVVFLVPWAVLYKSFIAQGMGLFMFVEMMVFVATLVLGLAFVWRKGALEWR